MIAAAARYTGLEWTQAQEDLAEDMKGMWANFAKASVPTVGHSLVNWPRFDPISQEITSLEAGGGPRTMTDLHAATSVASGTR
jgi:hypothetical protein